MLCLMLILQATFSGIQVCSYARAHKYVATCVCIKLVIAKTKALSHAQQLGQAKLIHSLSSPPASIFEN